MANNSEKIKEYLGITKWHNAGYTGKGVSILSMEQVKNQRKFPYVTAVNGFGDDDGGHGSKVMEQMKEIAPDATFYTCSKKGNADNWKPLYLDFIYRNKIALVASSKLSTQNKVSTTVERYMQECIDNGTTFFIAAGNQTILGGRGIYAETKSDKYLAIGACEFENGDVWKANYSCEGDELDFMTIVGYGKESGTSYAENRFCAMCALVQQFFLEKVGRTLYRSELVAFIMDNVKDLREKGFDKYTGYGLFILPEPESIDVYKYITHNEGCNYSGFPQIGEDKMEIKQMLLTPSEYNRPQTKINPTAIAWHYVGNPNTSAIANRNYFESLSKTKKTYASSHFIIGLEGEILQLIPEDEISFCTNEANSYTISVECCHPDDTGKFTEETYRSMLWLGKYLMKKHGITKNIRHYDVTGKCCPKWFVDNPSEWEKFKRELEGNSMDEKVSSWAETAWNWCKEKGYLDGSNPKGTVTREMLAQVLFNLFGKEENK